MKGIFLLMKRLFSILVIVISIAAGYQIISLWRGTFLYQKNLSPENLLKAIEITPSNPDPYYRLGVFYKWDLRAMDLQKSLHYLKEAIQRNPLEQEYWINLARIHQRMGDIPSSEKALENVIRVFPTGYQGRWISGNIFLQQGDLNKAIPHFTYILSHYPNQTHLVYELLKKVMGSPGAILDRIVPQDPFSFKQFLAYLYDTGDKEWAQKAWQRKEKFGYQPDREASLRHIEFLIGNGEIASAFQVWKDRLREEGIPIVLDENLITNGGFEKESVLGGGFDWRIGKISGAEVSYDHETAFEGKRSLKIVFNGKENLDFHHVSQYVFVRPNTRYALKARMRTKAITTKSGVKLEVLGVGPPFYMASETLIEDNEWREVEVSFQTPPHSKGGIVRVRRERTDKFDRFISGTVWMDNVSLKEEKSK